MPSITYFDSIVAGSDRRQELGTTNYDGEFVPMYLENGTSLNPEFVNVLDDERIASFRAIMRCGTATLRRENRKVVNGKPRFYWYAYKKVRGKLNKAYLGLSHQFSEGMLDVVIEEVSKPKEVTQNECVTKKTKAIAPVVSVELAGNGKNANHLQSNLLPVNEEIVMLKREVEHWKQLFNKDSDRIIVLNEEIRHIQGDRLAIINQRDAIAKEFAEYQDKHRNVGLAVDVSQERMQELETTIDRQADLILALRTDVDNHREEAATYYKQLEQEQWESSRREEQVQGYYFMHEELSEQVFKYRTLIEKYRLLAKDKDKRNHPRFAYLIDFLTEIDNLT